MISKKKKKEWADLEKLAGLPQGTIYDDKGADCVQHQLDNPEVYGVKN
jgi:hypothetical protein